MNSRLIRAFDVIAALIGLIVSIPVMMFIFLILLRDTRSPLFIQERVGRNKVPFKLLKFRTMRQETASVATHLVDGSAVTPVGQILRRTKLDELPQLFNVLRGDMSFVGPRPCLFSQKELIEERELRGVFQVRPGITGLAQINSVDMSTPQLLAEWDALSIRQFSFSSYLKLIFLTVSGSGLGDQVRSGPD